MPLTRTEILDAQAQAGRAMEYINMSGIASALQLLADRQREILDASGGINSIVDNLRRIGVQLRSAVDVLARCIPTNWSAIDMADGLDLASRGWPIVWVPRDDIVAMLVGAPDDNARDAVLRDSSDLILDDVEACIDGMRSSHASSVLIDALSQAVKAARESLWIACQVTTTTALDTIVGAETEIKRTKSHKEAEPVGDEILASELRIALILQALPMAFESFFVDDGDSIPTTYNRHASIHRLSNLQLTQRNALFSLLLTTSLLRELHEYGDAPITVGVKTIRTGRR